MNVEKGRAGYISARKKQMLIKVILEFGILAALLFLGIWQTGNRKNLLTIVAIVGCLPASKSAVGLITLLPYKSIGNEKVQELHKKAGLLTQVYDLVLTSREKSMPVDCFVISGYTLCGYTSNAKLDLQETAAYLKKMFEKNGYDRLSIKIFNEYKPFLARAEGLNNIAAIEKADAYDYEKQLKKLLLTISM